MLCTGVQQTLGAGMQILNYAASYVGKLMAGAFERLLDGMASADNSESEEYYSSYDLDYPHLSRFDADPWERDENETFY